MATAISNDNKLKNKVIIIMHDSAAINSYYNNNATKEKIY